MVILSGRHVVDTGHLDECCWNEVYPVRGIAKMSEGQYGRIDDSTESQVVIRRHCVALNDLVDSTERLGGL